MTESNSNNPSRNVNQNNSVRDFISHETLVVKSNKPVLVVPSQLLSKKPAEKSIGNLRHTSAQSSNNSRGSKGKNKAKSLTKIWSSPDELPVVFGNKFSNDVQYEYDDGIELNKDKLVMRFEDQNKKLVQYVEDPLIISSLPVSINNRYKKAQFELMNKSSMVTNLNNGKKELKSDSKCSSKNTFGFKDRNDNYSLNRDKYIKAIDKPVLRQFFEDSLSNSITKTNYTKLDKGEIHQNVLNSSSAVRSKPKLVNNSGLKYKKEELNDDYEVDKLHNELLPNPFTSFKVFITKNEDKSRTDSMQVLDRIESGQTTDRQKADHQTRNLSDNSSCSTEKYSPDPPVVEDKNQSQSQSSYTTQFNKMVGFEGKKKIDVNKLNLHKPRE